MSNELSESAARGIAARVLGAHGESISKEAVALVRAGYAAANLAEARREGAREALQVVEEDSHHWNIPEDAAMRVRRCIRNVRDREYPAPAPEAVTLTNGDRVTRTAKGWTRTGWVPIAPVWRWWDVLSNEDTGADFDALKAFAAKVGAA